MAKKNAEPTTTTNAGIRLLTKRQVMDMTHVSYPTLWNWMRAGTFPRSRVTGQKIVWLASEVEAWMTNLPVRELKGDIKKSA